MPRNQNVSLPSFMMKYIAQNWSDKVYRKLIRTCKHFYATHQILCISIIWDLDGQVVPGCWHIEDNHRISKDGVYLNLATNKVWITEKVLTINRNTSLSCFCEAIYKSSVTSIGFTGIHIGYDAFAKLGKNITTMEFANSSLYNNKGQKLSYGDIMAALPNLVEFNLWDHSGENINLRESDTESLPYLPNLKTLFIVSGNVDSNDYCEFIKIHPGRTFIFYIFQFSQLNPLKDILCEAFPNGRPNNRIYEHYNAWFFNINDTVIEMRYRLL